MNTIFFILLAIGLIGSIVCFFLYKNAQKDLSWWANVLPASPAEAKNLDDYTPVAVEGVTCSDNLLTDPLSGQPCVWWRHRAVERWQEKRRNSDGTYDTTSRSNVLFDNYSGQPFGIKDQNGVVYVEPMNNPLDASKNVLRSRSRNEERDHNYSGLRVGPVDVGFGPDSKQIVYSVDFLPADIKILVSGRMEGGYIVRDEKHNIKVSRQSVEEESIQSGRAMNTIKMFGYGSIALFAVGLVGVLLSSLL